MLNAIKVLSLVVVSIVFALPLVFLSVGRKRKKEGKTSPLRYEAPKQRRNAVFFLIAVLLLVAFSLLAALLNRAVNFLYALPFIGTIISAVVNAMSNKTDYILLALRVLLFNAVFLWGYLIIKLAAKRILNRVFRKLEEAKSEEHKTDDEPEPPKEDPVDPAGDQQNNRAVRRYVHLPLPKQNDTEPEEQQESIFERIARWYLGLFFEGDSYEYGKPGAVRAKGILQMFIRLTETLYFILIMLQALSLVFSMPAWMYTFLMDWIHIDKWYMYPFIALMILQEVCNYWNADLRPHAEDVMREEPEEQPVEEEPVRLEELHNQLMRKYDEDHLLRCFPAQYRKGTTEYRETSTSYRSSLQFIRRYIELHHDHVAENYMECLDALFNDNHVYVGAPFYSEIGEYLTCYTYIRLLAGYRLVFIVSDASKMESLRTFLNERLKDLTGTTNVDGWRIFTADERLDQADILITTPSAFCDNDMAERYPDFFEEVCNAVLIDADRVVALDSYRCPIMAKTLMNATNHSIHFIFLTKYVLGGFSTATLPSFFCLNQVSNYSAAKENAPVEYYVWNLESKRHRIYHKGGQKLTSLEALIAEEACSYGVDGVRIWSSSPMEHADELSLRYHRVEINEFYKEIPKISYLIYTDDACNLAASMYVCTRFEGREKSFAHILCKPYLLREYFMSRSSLEKYINRSSIIQPRVSSHADQLKMSFLRIFCEACSGDGMSVSTFSDEVQKVIVLSSQRQETPPCPWCRDNLTLLQDTKYKLTHLVEYFIAALCDKPDTKATESAAKRAKDFYLVVNHLRLDGTIDKFISFKRAREVYACLFRHMKRVELRLNDKCIGYLDTFPERVRVEYIVGQSLIYNNVEYVIDRISEKADIIFLRSENVTMRYCLDTFFLRRYRIHSGEELTRGVWNFNRTNITELRTTLVHGDFDADTYGFYSLMSNNQTLDFYHGVEGVFEFDEKAMANNTRVYKNGHYLKITMDTRLTCTDGMRLLLSAVINELIRTIFPDAYKCAAFCPILEEPVTLCAAKPTALPPAEEPAETNEAGEIETNVPAVDKADIEKRIRSMYPYIQSSDIELVPYTETEKNSMTFLLINDSMEDVGILDWFASMDMRYMCEFLAIVYSFLHWLDSHPEPGQYIYFGGEALPECYDIKGCLALLEGMSFVMSDSGENDYETGSDVGETDDSNFCSFCHKHVYPGRYYLFDNNRYICPHCRGHVVAPAELPGICSRILGYLTETYPEQNFRMLSNVKIKQEGPYDLTTDQLQSEYNYRVDFDNHVICVEQDDPLVTVEVSVLRGLIAIWQHENELCNSYADAQLYFEELLWRMKDPEQTEGFGWVEANLPEEIRRRVEQIKTAVANGQGMIPVMPDDKSDSSDEADTPDTDEMTDTPEDGTEDGSESESESGALPVVHDSFEFLRTINSQILLSDEEEEENDEVIDTLDPDRTPRFWKKFVLGMNPEDDDPHDLQENDEESDLTDPGEE